jgi:hypothetical protein
MGNCANHPKVPAAGRCFACAEEFCSNCLVNLQGQNYCGSCKTLALQGKIPTAAVAVQEAQGMPSPLAKEALTLAIVSLFCFGFILGPMAIYKGTQAKKEISANPGMTGDGKATAAIVIGVISLLLNIVVIGGNIARNNR